MTDRLHSHHAPNDIPQKQRRSDAIGIARVVCIMGVVYVHAWTGLDGHDLALVHGTAQEQFRWILMEAFGRSAVPLLGLISGWLVSGSARTALWQDHVKRKARTILVPMILWNILALLLVSGSAWLFTLPAPTPQSAGWILQEVLILTHNPDINVQMPFLRDLFICMLLAPLLIRLPLWGLGIAGLIAAACHIAGIGAPFMLRVSILFFFILGFAARRVNLADRVAALPWSVVAVPFAALMSAKMAMAMAPVPAEPGAPQFALDLAARVSAAALYWRLAWALAGSAVRGSILKIEPFMFFYFCSHLIIIWLGGPLLGRLTGKLGSPLYPVYLLSQPLLVLAVVVPFAHVLLRLAPGIALLLSGGRLRPAIAPSEALATARA